MQKTSLLSGLILVFSLMGGTVQDDTTAAVAVSSAANEAATNAPQPEGSTSGASPAPEASSDSGASPAPEANSDTGASPDPGASPDSGTSPAPGAGSNSAKKGRKCPPSQLLTGTGCVDRKVFLNRIKMLSWNDEGFDKPKEKYGILDTYKCKDNQVMTPYGCSKSASVDKKIKIKVPVLHSSLNNDQVMHSNIRSSFVRNHAIENTPKRKGSNSDAPINAHNRPLKHYILPGRKLRTDRRCRPYEVIGPDGKCVRKKGKKGVYKHRNHVYGLQRRHRHPASKPSSREREGKKEKIALVKNASGKILASMEK